MATVIMTFTPLPAHVRTARLVATAVARRSGVAESLLDEVRLAVGEACSRAVEVHQERCPGQPVRVALTGEDGRFEVTVTNTGGPAAQPAPGGPAPAPGTAAPGCPEPGGGCPPAPGGPAPMGAAGGSVAAGPPMGAAGGSVAAGPPVADGAPLAASAPVADLGLAVIAGLADEVVVSQDGSGTSIRMSWPAGRDGQG
jgi:serine/threonine-protein kinase RsbW